ncbi:MAG: hypothetical protein ACFFCV_18805 [Promethearchaeota archaeon]
MEEKKIDFKKLDEELIDIYNSSKRPNKAIEKKIKEAIVND